MDETQQQNTMDNAIAENGSVYAGYTGIEAGAEVETEPKAEAENETEAEAEAGAGL